MRWVSRFVLGLVFSLPAVTSTAQPAMTVKELDTALAAKPQGDEAMRLADQIRTAFGGRNGLLRGLPPKVDELTVAWAIELAEPLPPNTPPPAVVRDTGNMRYPMTQLGGTNVFALVRTLSSGTAFTWHYEAGDRRFGGSQLEVWEPHPDSREKPGVPKGAVRQMPSWSSEIFKGTTRDWWIYVPAQYRPESPAAVMVFQDGNGPRVWVPAVFDNLIAKGDMPPTIAVFINPGHEKDKPRVQGKHSNRGFEYDTLSDQYARFLLEEILPEVEKTLKLRHDAAGRAIAGQSSGGICAFTVAWERPEQFSKVISWTGSFTNIAAGADRHSGGHNYEALVRRTPKKPIRVILQDGANDLDNVNGNWFLSNQTLAKSLEFAGYDYRADWGPGFHSYAHGRAIFPDSLRWLWRESGTAAR